MSRAGCPYDKAPMERYYNMIGTIRYAHTRITDIRLRLKREWSIPLSSGVTKNVDHYNDEVV